ELRVLGVHDRPAIPRMAKPQCMADLVAQDLADLSRRKRVTVVVMERDDDFGVRDPRILIGATTRQTNSHLIRGELLDPSQHDVRARRVRGKRETERDPRRLPLEEHIPGGLDVADPPVANVWVGLDPNAYLAIWPAKEHRVLRRQQIENVRPARAVCNSSANLGDVA